MSRNGSEMFGLLHELHADGCDGTEYSGCRPVVVPQSDRYEKPASIEVVFMEWCGECGAADWEVV